MAMKRCVARGKGSFAMKFWKEISRFILDPFPLNSLETDLNTIVPDFSSQCYHERFHTFPSPCFKLRQRKVEQIGERQFSWNSINFVKHNLRLSTKKFASLRYFAQVHLVAGSGPLFMANCYGHPHAISVTHIKSKEKIELRICGLYLDAKAIWWDIFLDKCACAPGGDRCTVSWNWQTLFREKNNNDAFPHSNSDIFAAILANSAFSHCTPKIKNPPQI